MSRRRVFLAYLLLVLGACATARGERVGFKFTGTLVGTGTQTLFGITVPRNSPVSGAFSYDTTSAAIEVEPGLRAFHQHIHGGYSLDINNGAIRLSASDYLVSVANDLPSKPEAIDLFGVDFDSRLSSLSAPLLVNGTPWLGPTAFIKIELSWAAATFTEPDEPKITPNRPLTPSPGIVGLVNSGAGSAKLFSIDAISEIAQASGDYNRNGALDANDYAEWRRAFGKSDPSFLYGDGNKDGVVDAADYVAWRKTAGSGNAFAPVPEPHVPATLVTGCITLAMWFVHVRVLLIPRSRVGEFHAAASSCHID
jgi:hypothetical protein